MWSDYVNGEIYQFVAFVLQASKAHNITIDGGDKFDVPSGNFTGQEMGNSSPNLTSYSTPAIIGADDFNDDNTTVTDLFDIIVNVTRQVTPTCAFPSSPLSSFSLTYHQSSWHRLELWVCGGCRCILRTLPTRAFSVLAHLDGPSVPSSDSPHSPPSSLRTLSSSLEIQYVQPPLLPREIVHSLNTVTLRLTRLHRSRTRK